MRRAVDQAFSSESQVQPGKGGFGHRATSMVASVALIASLLVVAGGILATPALADTSQGLQGNTGESCPHDGQSDSTVSDNAGHVYVFWQNWCSASARNFFQVSSDSGKTFSDARSICSAIASCVQNGTTSDSGYAGTTDQYEDDATAWVDTSVSPPALYVAFGASTSFSNVRPYVIRLLKSTDFGATFTLLGSVPSVAANIGSVLSTPCGTASGATTQQCGYISGAASGNNIYLSIGEAAPSATVNTNRRGLLISTDGGSTWSNASACGGAATCTGPNGGDFEPDQSYLDSAGNYWTVWDQTLGQVAPTGNGSADTVYSISETTAGSTTTTWGADIYRTTEGPTYPGGQAAPDDAGSGNYLTNSFLSGSDASIDPSNDTQYMVLPMNENNTAAYVAPGATVTNPSQSILRLAQCTTSCTDPTNWSGYNAGDLKLGAQSNPRVDDKEAAGACGGTVGNGVQGTDKCSVDQPALSVNASHVVSIAWLDDRLGNPTNCPGLTLDTALMAWSHACAVNTYLRTSNGSYNATDGGFTAPSVRINTHAPSSPVSTTTGFKYPYGATGLTDLPSCPTGDSSPATLAFWSEAHDYNGGSPNGGLLYVTNNQTGPASPNLGASGNDSDNNIAVSWTAVSGATQYKLFRATNGFGANMSLYQTFSGSTTSYTDTAVTPGTEYSYTVSAVTGAGESCQSASSQGVSGQSKAQLTTAVSPNNDPTNTPTTSSIATIPASPDLKFKKYSKVSAVADLNPARDASSRWRFSSWTVSPTSFSDGTLNANIAVGSTSSNIAPASTSINMAATRSDTITGLSASGMNATTTVTYTCASCGTNDLVGQTINVSGVVGGTGSLNGTKVITAVDATHVTAVCGASTCTTGATFAGATVVRAGASGTGGNIAASPTGATESANTVTITTTASQNLFVGAPVTIAGVGVAGYNGSFTVLTVPSATTFTYTDATSGLAASGGGTWTSNAAIINTTTAHGLTANTAFNVAGVTPSGYNGAFTVGGVPSTLSLTYNPGAASLGNSSVAGTVQASNSGATESGNTVTLTTNATTSVSVGDAIAVAGVGVFGYNGSFTAIAPTGGTTVTYTDGTSGLAPSGSGTVSVNGASMQVNEASHATEPATPFIVQVDNEQMTVTAVSGSGPYTYTITRGANGTTAATHSNGAAVSYPTARSGCTTDRTSCTLQMQGAVTLTANYVKQWAVTATETGFNCDDNFDPVCDVPTDQKLIGESGTNLATTTFGPGDLAYSGTAPATTYVDDGGTVNYRVGYAGQKVNSICTVSATPGIRGLNVANSTGFNVGDTILVSGAQVTANDANWDGIWTVAAAGSGSCVAAANRILFTDPAGGNGGGTGANGIIANGAQLFVTDVGNASQGANTPSGTNLVLPVYGSNDVSLDDAAGYPNTFPPDPNKQYRYLSTQAGPTGGSLSNVNAFGSLTNVSGPQTINATYGTAHKVRYDQNGLGAGDTSGTIATVPGFGDGASSQTFTQAQLPAPATGGTFQADNQAFNATYTSPVASTGTGAKRYVATTTAYTGLLGNQSTSGFSSYANASIAEATYDAGSSTETYYCETDVACPFSVGQTVTVSGFTDPLNATLNANISNSATSATVNEANHAAEPQVPFSVGIDNEQVSVTAVSGTGPYTYTIARAQNGTTAAAHTAGASVAYTLTASLNANISNSDTTASVNEVSHGSEPAVPFNVTIGNEEVSVTAVSGTSNPFTYTIARAQNSTTAAGHSAGDSVIGVNTCAGCSNYNGNRVITAVDTGQGSFTAAAGATAPTQTDTYNALDPNLYSGQAVNYSIPTSTQQYKSQFQTLTVATDQAAVPASSITGFHADGWYDQSTTLTAPLSPTGTDSNLYTFTGWTGCDSTSGGSNQVCAVDTSTAKTVTAHYAEVATHYVVTSSDYNPPAGTSVTISAQLTGVGGNPIHTSGVVVTWSNTGAGGSFASPTSTTDANGLAQVQFTVSSSAGVVHTVTATDGSSFTGTSANITTAKINQTITFGSLANKTYGDADFPVSATASSGNAVTFTASGNCMVTADGTVTHLTGAGSCTIHADQAGDANYNAAPTVDQSFSIAKANQTITFGSIPDHQFGDPDFSVSATASSGLDVTFTAAGQCTVTSDGSIVHLTGAGSCTIHADQAGSVNYNAAPTVDQSFNITSNTNNVITFGPIANHTFGDADFGVSASASSNLDVNFTAAGDCTVSADLNTATVHLTGAGSCTVTAHQPGDNNYDPANNVDQSFSIAKANQTINFGSLANKTYGDADFPVSATASSGNAVTFTASGNCMVTADGTVTHLTGAGSCTIHADQAGDANYNAAPTVDQSFSIAKANQTITFGSLANKTYGDADFPVSATASSGNAVTFTASGNCMVTADGTVTHLTGAGSCTIHADQAGDANYNAAPTVDQSFSIAKANQTITFGSLANKTYGDPNFGVSATASSGLAVAFSSATPTVCTVSGSTVHLVDGGTCTINADQAGNANYNAAPTVAQSFTVSARATTATLGIKPHTIAQGGTVTANVTIKDGGFKPTGTVQIKVDNVIVGTGTLNALGKVKITFTASQSLGNHSVKAFFVANSKFLGSVSISKNLQIT